MDKTFELKKGKLVFEGDKIVICDKARRQKAQMLFMSGCWVFYGTISVYRYLKTDDQFQLWTGLLIGIGHFVIFVKYLFISVKSEISINEVKTMKVKSRNGNNFLDIKLNSGLVRRIIQIEDRDELQRYIDKISAR
jgi:hypothetical protein